VPEPLPPCITASTPEELAAHLDLPVFRGRQLRAWVFERGAESFPEMTDLPVELRESLPDRLRVTSSEIAERSGTHGGTTKLLVRMEDGALVECVLIPEGKRLTLCISSQVGCPAACAFCASGLRGLDRNLAAHEIVEQYLLAAREAGGRDRITNIVMMGMGEPLMNYDAVVAAIRDLEVSARRITLSTVGLPPQIRRLAGEGLKLNLAVSLHAPNDELRNRLVPINRRHPLAQVIAAARDYFHRTRRDVTFEYILIRGENAGEEHARELAALLGRGHLNVNLIPMNPVAGLPFRRPPWDEVDSFQKILIAAGIPTHVRRPRGREIDAACGQLRLHRLH